MGASAGGTNVGGVYQAEQGIPSLQSVPTVLSQVGGENITLSITVPAGHRYLLKAMSLSVGNFIGTLSATALRIYNTTAVKDIALATGTSATSLILQFNQPITLVAGDKANYQTTTTAWTSGQLNCNILYQDITL